jgi:hypothetical protein
MKRINFTARIESSGELIEDQLKVWDNADKKKNLAAVITYVSKVFHVPAIDVIVLDMDNQNIYEEYYE